MTDAPVQPPPPPPSKETLKVWASYSRDRFDSASKRVDEFRNWARQLGGAVAVVIGFELTLVGRVLDLKPPFDASLRTWTLVLFLLMIAAQVLLLFWALRTGYSGHTVVGPESPSKLAEFIVDADEAGAEQLTGAYYAKAYDAFHDLSEELGKSVGQANRFFAVTVGILVIGVALVVKLAVSPGPSQHAYTGAMSNPVAPPTPASAPRSGAASSTPPAQAQPGAGASPPASAPSPAAGKPPSILVTPTDDQRQTFTAKPTTDPAVMVTPAQKTK